MRLHFEDRAAAAPHLTPVSGTPAASGYRLVGALALVLACIGSGASRAEAAETAAASESGGAPIADIVVTARHTTENVQKTPIAIAVYGGDKLKQNGVTDLTSLAALAPDINITVTEGQPIIAVRGISSRDTNENGDPAVSVSTDGFYVNRPFGLDAAMYDLDRIEVLHGPQGTLSGRNSVGGTLNIITAKPADKFAAYTSVEYGSYNDLQLEGMINAPITANLKARLSFLSSSRDGYRDTGTQTKGDSADNKSVRLQIAYEPTPNLHALLTAQYTSETGSGDVLQYIPFKYTASGALDHSLPAGINASAFPLGTQPFLKLKDTQVRGNLVYDLGQVEMTLLAGYDKIDYSQGVDQTLPNGTGPAYQWQPSQYPETVNGELRFASHGSGPLQWQFGGFFFNESGHLFSADAQAIPTSPGGTDYTFGFVYRTHAKSEAGYAHASYQLTPELKLSGGLRYSHDYKFETGYFGALTAGIVFGSGTGSMSSSKLTYSAGLDYQVTPRNLLYAKVDTGYKAGGFNLGVDTYKPETATSYEIGSKNRFLDGTLQVNLAAYFTDYTDQQVSSYTILPGTTQATAITLNAGSSHIYGLEADVIYNFLPGWRIDLNANWLHARYKSFTAAADPSDPQPNNNPYPVDAKGNVQLAGNPLPQSPNWSLSAGLEKDWDIGGGKLTARIQTKAQAKSNFSFYNLPDTAQKAYTMSDFFLTYQSSGGRWKLTGFVKNLENSVVFRDAEESQYTGAYGYEFMPPRTYGARFEYNW